MWRMARGCGSWVEHWRKVQATLKLDDFAFKEGAELHIWYVHPYAGGPGLGTHYRTYHLARAWQQQGHSATIFVAGFHHLRETKDALPATFEIDGVKYVTVPARAYTGNGVGRILNMADFSSRLRQAGRKYGGDVPRPDAIIVSSPHPFSIFAGHALARRYDAKLIFEIRDIWPLSLTEILGVSPRHPFVLMCGYAERFALDKADLITSVLPRADQYIAERGYAAKPFQWVPNGLGKIPADKSTMESQEGRIANAKLEEWKAQGKVTTVYAGSLGAPNGIDLLLEALSHGKSLAEVDHCAALIIGRGEQLDALRAYAAERGLTDVHFAGWLPKGDTVALIKKADIAYAGLRNIQKLFRYGISPNKLVDYFKASLPVVLPIAPCGDPVSESGGGIAHAMEKPEAVWSALNELIRQTQGERQRLGALGKAYMEREYAFDDVAKRYIQAIDRLHAGV